MNNNNFKEIRDQWRDTLMEAIATQKDLRRHISLAPLKKKICSIAGANVSMNWFGNEGVAGFVTMSYGKMRPADHSVVKDKAKFPYIPGLLSFREIPMLLKAWYQLKSKPDVVIVDGVGITHPKKLGLATHLGIMINRPTIGCSKNVLTGQYEEPGDQPGDHTYIYDSKNTNDAIGAAIRSKQGQKPIFVSPGHLITLEETIEIIKNCIKKDRMPEPTRLVHDAVNEYRARESLNMLPA
jgi:deoxyribonuclease V